MERSPRPAQLELTIRELVKELQEMSVTPHVRELRAKAVTYGRVIANWATYAPTSPQLQAMLECVTELAEKVVSAKRGEVSRVSKKPTAGGQRHEPRADLPPPLPGAALDPFASLPPLPVPPNGVAWNANVSDSGRPMKISERATAAPPRPTTIPPVSAPRAIDPSPALLRARRHR